MRAGMVLGILGVLVGLGAATVALLVYDFHGIGSPSNPYASRLWLGIVAFLLALVIGVGASLLRAHTELGALLMIVGSIGGTLALAAFSAGPSFVYYLSVPFSLLGAFLAVRQATPTASVALLRWLTLLLLAAGVVAGLYLGGLLAAIPFAVAFLIAAGLVLTQSGDGGRG